jgi:hypothetical protein
VAGRPAAARVRSINADQIDRAVTIVFARIVDAQQTAEFHRAALRFAEGEAARRPAAQTTDMIRIGAGALGLERRAAALFALHFFEQHCLLFLHFLPFLRQAAASSANSSQASPAAAPIESRSALRRVPAVNSAFVHRSKRFASMVSFPRAERVPRPKLAIPIRRA